MSLACINILAEETGTQGWEQENDCTIRKTRENMYKIPEACGNSNFAAQSLRIAHSDVSGMEEFLSLVLSFG